MVAGWSGGGGDDVHCRQRKPPPRPAPLWPVLAGSTAGDGGRLEWSWTRRDGKEAMVAASIGTAGIGWHQLAQGQLGWDTAVAHE